MTSNPIAYWGGKQALAARILALAPAHVTYCEPYFGGGAVLLAHDPQHAEIVGDIDRVLVNFWACIRDSQAMSEMQRYLEAMPVAQEEWAAAHAAVDFLRGGRRLDVPDVRAACDFFVNARLSRSQAGRGWGTVRTTRLRRGRHEMASRWETAIEGLLEVSDRLRRVIILCGTAEETMLAADSPVTWHYLDPPYPPCVRVTKDAYPHDMTDAQHEELLRFVRDLRGKVAISTYPNPIYDAALGDWSMRDFKIDKKASVGESKPKATERIYANYVLPEGAYRDLPGQTYLPLEDAAK